VLPDVLQAASDKAIALRASAPMILREENIATSLIPRAGIYAGERPEDGEVSKVKPRSTNVDGR
jgi:hypothetical protein